MTDAPELDPIMIRLVLSGQKDAALHIGKLQVTLAALEHQVRETEAIAIRHLEKMRAERDALAARVAELEAALRPFADIGIGTDPDYEPMIRMDRAAIVAARTALAKP